MKLYYNYLPKDEQFSDFPVQYIEAALPKAKPSYSYQSIDVFIINGTSKDLGYRLYCSQFEGDIQEQIDSNIFPYLEMVFIYLHEEIGMKVNLRKIKIKEISSSPF